MKKYRLPDSDQWEKIVDEAFSSDEIHTFSEKYNLKKYQDYPIRKGITMKKNNLLMNLTVVATALAVVAVPTGVYIAGNMTSTKSQTQYAQQEPSENEPASPVAEKETSDTIYNVEYGWLPEGFNRNDDTSYSYFTDTDNNKIFMIASFVKNLSGEKTENGVALTVRDEYQIDNKTVDIRYQGNYVENSTDKDTTNYGRVATIYFNDTPYELELLVTDDVTKDDFAKIIENIRLIESDTEIASIYEVTETEITITDGNDDGQTVTETEFTISDGNDDGQINEGIHQFTEDDIDYDTIYDVEYGWLPKGLEYQSEESPYGGKFHNWATNDGMTPVFTRIPEDTTYREDTGNPEIEVTVDKWLLDGKNIVMYYRSTYIPDNPEHNFGRIAFIYFNNTPYVLKLYVTDGISEEDFRKIIENVKLVPSEEETAGIYTQPEETDEEVETRVNGHDPGQEDVTIYQIDDEIAIDYEFVYGQTKHFTVKIDDVSFDKDFKDGDLYNYLSDKNCLDENGHLVDNVRQWVKREDTQYKELESEVVPTSIMTVTLTYTNTGDLQLDYPALYDFFTKRNNKFYNPLYINMFEHSGVYESTLLKYKDTFNVLKTEAISDYWQIYRKSDKDFSSLAKGESVQVEVSFIVEDKFRDNLYLNLGFFSSESGAVSGWHIVDLSNIE